MADLFGTVASTVVVVQAKGGEASGIGSGVLISPDGKIMTAAHLVHGAEKVVVKFLGGRSVEAHVIASELAADLSLIQLNQVPAGLRAAKLANSDQVRVGDQVIVVGAPYGLSHSLSVGWISARWAPSTMYKASRRFRSRSSSKPTRVSIRATPAAPCSAWREKSSGS